MRRTAILLILLTLAICPAAAGSECSGTSLGLQLSWDLGLKFSVEQELTPGVSLHAAAGTYLFLPMFIADGSYPLVQEALLIIDPLPPESQFRAGLALGIPVSSLMLYHDSSGVLQTGFMFAAGGDLFAGWDFGGGTVLRLYIGGGVPFIYDAGVWKSVNMNFMFGLWPDFDLELIWKL